MKPVPLPEGVSAFALVAAVNRRSRQLERGEIPLVLATVEENVVSVALREIGAGVVTIVPADAARKAGGR